MNTLKNLQDRDMIHSEQFMKWLSSEEGDIVFWDNIKQNQMQMAFEAGQRAAAPAPALPRDIAAVVTAAGDWSHTDINDHTHDIELVRALNDLTDESRALVAASLSATAMADDSGVTR